MLRTIEKFNGFAIQKVTHRNGSTLRYQTVAESSIGDASAVACHKTLKDAREHLHIPTAQSIFTAPKSVNPQNQKGYRADTRKAK